MSNKFCFMAIISKLSREDVWKIRHHELSLPFPWFWFVTSSCVHFSSLKTLAMQTSLFTSYQICRKLSFIGSKCHRRATRSAMEGEEKRMKWHLSHVQWNKRVFTNCLAFLEIYFLIIDIASEFIHTFIMPIPPHSYYWELDKQIKLILQS